MSAVISLGMPVYNGSRFVRRALDSLLAQDFAEFELLISDNASTDDTVAICLSYANRDHRIRVETQPVNRGASWNFNHVLSTARRELFAWVACDDEWHPHFLSTCVRGLRERTSTVCQYTAFQPIDEDSRPHGEPFAAACEGATRRERWQQLLRDWRVHGSIYGVMRTDVVRRTRGLLPYTSADLVFMAELALHGDIAVAPEALHLKRMKSRDLGRSKQDVMVLLGARRPALWKVLFNRARVLRHELSGLRHAGLPAAEERTLARDAIAHYVTSLSWKHDLTDTVLDLLGPERSAWLRSRTRGA